MSGSTGGSVVHRGTGAGTTGLAALCWEADLLTAANKKPTRGQLSTDQLAFNSLHAALRAIGERANTLLKTTLKALRRVSLDPSRIGDSVGGALVLLQVEQNRPT